MVSRIGIRRYSQNIKFTNGYKEEEYMEKHDRLRPQGTRHIEEKDDEEEEVSSIHTGCLIFLVWCQNKVKVYK